MANLLDCPSQRHTKPSPNATSEYFLFISYPKKLAPFFSFVANILYISGVFSWNEWVSLPHLFSELPRSAMLAITILDCAGAGQISVIGGTTISLFGKNGLFRQVNNISRTLHIIKKHSFVGLNGKWISIIFAQGMFDLRVWIDVEADGSTETTTPGKGKDTAPNQMQRLAKLAKKHRNGQISKVDWLDRLTFREIEVINEREKSESDHLYLLIEFPAIICEQTNQTVRFSWNLSRSMHLVIFPSSFVWLHLL